MVTIQDVAKEAGVSKATVSYVLSGSSLISKETSQRVMAAVDKLGYSVNHAARVLSTKQTKTIGIVSPGQRGERFSLSFGAYLYSLSCAASKYGYDCLMLVNDDKNELIKNTIRERKVDGLILMDVRNNDARLPVIKKSGFPTLLLGATSDDEVFNIVDTNYECAARSIVDFVADKGHEEILFINWPQQMQDAQLNFVIRFDDTLRKSATERNIIIHTIHAAADTFGASDEIRVALAKYPRVSCLIVHNDAAVISLPQVLSELNIRVPEDLSVVCVVPDQMGIGMHIPYSAVEINIDNVAEVTVQSLISQIQNHNNDMVHKLIEQPLVDNGSVATNR